jgi:alkanesulfonate monooxygenase SsuD/methylene tetrahydromethanopterin reductase-like flavin-dependent oxidoreductase (luciferase family)
VEVWLFNITPWPRKDPEVPIPFPPSLWDQELASELYHETLAIDRLADELGFDGVCFAEHHYGTTSLTPSPNLTAAAVATHTSNAKIVLMGNCLPLHAHPVRLAEELAMIDVMSGGRLVSGFIRGGVREYTAYSIEIRQGREMFQEAWDLIVKAWTDPEPFAWHGQHYNYDVVSILPRPLQQPHPQIVLGGNTAESIEWAAEHRVPLFTSLSPTSQIAETFAYYRTYAQESCGWTPSPEYNGVSRHVYVGTTDAKAREAAEDHVRLNFRAPASRGEAAAMNQLDGGRHTERSFDYKTEQHQHRPRSGDMQYEQLEREGYIIVGSPDTVVRKIKEQQEALGGFGTFIPYIPFGEMQPPETRRVVELFGKEVLPHLR